MNPIVLVTIGIIILLFLFFAIFFSGKLIFGQKNRKSKNNPLSLGIEYVDSFFKIIKINFEKRIILLGYNPSTEYPFGTSESWFKIGDIPKELLIECTVLKIEKKDDGGIIYKSGPQF